MIIIIAIYTAGFAFCAFLDSLELLIILCSYIFRKQHDVQQPDGGIFHFGFLIWWMLFSTLNFYGEGQYPRITGCCIRLLVVSGLIILLDNIIIGILAKKQKKKTLADKHETETQNSVAESAKM